VTIGDLHCCWKSNIRVEVLAFEGFCEPEIDEFGFVVVSDHRVCGFDIAMKDFFAMGCGEPSSDAYAEGNCAKPRYGLWELFEGNSLNEFGDAEGIAIGRIADAMHDDDVGVRNAS